MIKHEGTVQTALTTDVFLALEQLQEVVDEKRDVVMGCAPYTAILWRDGELHYKSYFDPDEMTWTDGLLIGIIASTKVVDWHDRIVTELDQDGLDKISRAWVSALTGLESRQVSIDLANGRIPANYGVEGLKINPATFVGEFVDLPEAATDEDYLDLLESQLEALLVPLSDPSLYLKQVEDFADDLWFRDDLLAEEILDAIEWLRAQRDLSDALWSARDHLRLI
jgi:hypothetical protein